ncbi:decaprenylphospho-beta-D-erythro-pentofuranosid-2-ulose 2-reductase [Mumia zhuanghuii]|uniref:Decaprenylphospho-beta-D-erythro-pentofuranosid-2-ulose 2-reductase n=1 Tax=Mumia zhuanghuii TaxID=2585211 RepID=A0A5C4M8J9_9ACTN|nr:decaprenylphospho-beta-D-erythro-pentofuranosid-2-ulose 2-reductase [Mumia zhuanghuii]TNC27571.1 decaprenylphospho-beta-D-erythro-pentofuranosid-2-ulose 2-reductase [Mumia zhuanghuii]
MIDATGTPQSLLLLGGTSDIGLAIVHAYAQRRAGLRVVLAARPSPRRDAASEAVRGWGATVETVDFDAHDLESHARVVEEAAAGGDIDLAVVAFGLLGDNEKAWQDVEVAAEIATVNYTAAVTVGVALGGLVRRQGHGRIVALSSVAGERPRRSNFVYGSTKAGFDSFYTGLGEALRPCGGSVLVVRPGFVHSSMTAGLDPAPLAVSPDDVAAAVVSAVAAGREQIWVPRTMRTVMSGLRHLPRPVFRRLPI